MTNAARPWIAGDWIFLDAGQLDQMPNVTMTEKMAALFLFMMLSASR
jgi:hypothetical protein